MLLIIILVAIIGLAVYLYNQLTRSRINIQESFSQIDVQLKRRNDLIPNLINTVKGYRDFEKDTLSEVTRLRNQVVDAKSVDEKMQASDQLSKSINNIFVTAEAYPDLKSSQNFLNLQEELTNTENKLSYARQLYNSSVSVYNKKLQVFPSNIIANMFGFKEEQFLQTPDEEKSVPEVKF